MLSIRIDVTEKHIAYGSRHNSDACPIALALRENGYPEAAVYKRTWHPGGTSMSESKGAIRLPEHVVEWISTFDRRGASSVTPTRFYLPLGDPE